MSVSLMNIMGRSLINMNNTSLVNFIEDRLACELSALDDVNISDIAEELAISLENNGYCSEPYFEYEKALMCPINKRREKCCNCTQCESYTFCTILRKENYI
jgi:hypothetical protein